MSPDARLRCRQIGEADFAALATLLHAGYPTQSEAVWLRGFAHMRERASPVGPPRYGYMLEQAGRPVGVLLTLFTGEDEQGRPRLRCNVSSWYVEPAFRGHGVAMVAQLMKLKGATLMNVSPMPPTWPILEAQGYRRYSEGQFACLPALKLGGPGRRVRRYRPETDAAQMAGPQEAALMAYHDRLECLSLVVETAGGRLVPFVFRRRSVKSSPLTYAQLYYCRDTADFVRMAGPLGRWLLGRWLLGRGGLFAVLDADGPVPGLIGRFVKDRVPKYYRGPDRPRQNDLAYTEGAVLGV